MMSRFNTSAQNPRETVNYEGAKAYNPPTNEFALYCNAACALLENQYYRSGREQKTQLISLADSCNPEFVAQLAIFLREEMHLRSVPMLLVATLIRRRSVTKDVVARVIQRADEIKELVAAWLEVEELAGSARESLRPVPAAVRKGLAEAFNKFNAFQYRKYNKGAKEAITFKDVLQLVHPEPRDAEMSDNFVRILDGALEPVDTWETMYSACKSDMEKAAVWDTLLLEGKLPYMAALRNIRNMLEVKVKVGTIDRWVKLISDPDAVKKSKQFPFRWLSAYRMLEQSKSQVPLTVFQSLEAALQASVDNIPAIERFREGRTLIACDSSGSMNNSLSEKSTLKYSDVAYTLGSMLAHYAPNNVTVGVFGHTWQCVNLVQGGILHNTENLRKTDVGCYTNGYLVAEWALTENRRFDTIVFFTDCQMWNSVPYSTGLLSTSMANYWNRVNPNTKVYVFDLAGYGHSPVDLVHKNAFMISGWSDHVFRVLSDIEKGNLPFWEKSKPGEEFEQCAREL